MISPSKSRPNNTSGFSDFLYDIRPLKPSRLKPPSFPLKLPSPPAPPAPPPLPFPKLFLVNSFLTDPFVTEPAVPEPFCLPPAAFAAAPDAACPLATSWPPTTGPASPRTWPPSPIAPKLSLPPIPGIPAVPPISHGGISPPPFIIVTAAPSITGSYSCGIANPVPNGCSTFSFFSFSTSTNRNFTSAGSPQRSTKIFSRTRPTSLERSR